MDRLRLLHAGQLSVCRFDLIDRPGLSEDRVLRVAPEEDPVRPSLDQDGSFTGGSRLPGSPRLRSGLLFSRGSLRSSAPVPGLVLLRQPDRITDRERHFRRVFRPLFALELPVHPGAFEHRFFRCAGRPFIQIPGAHHKFHQVPDGNPDCFTHNVHPLRSIAELPFSCCPDFPYCIIFRDAFK